MLRTGRHVLVSDSDVVWVKSPLALLETLREGGATIGASTDCLDLSADRDNSPRASSPFMCGHSPGYRNGAVFNTVVLCFAAVAQAPLRFLREWALSTLRLSDEWSDDQGVFNRLVTTARPLDAGADPFYPVTAAGLGGRIINAPFGLKMAPLPAEFFCSGHLVRAPGGLPRAEGGSLVHHGRRRGCSPPSSASARSCS